MLGPASVIQSTFGGNLEAVVPARRDLTHWHAEHIFNRDGDPVFTWRPELVISDRATGAGCIIQSNVGSPGNFEVVVLEDDRLVHYWKDNSDVRNLWQPGGVISTRATGPGCIIQSNVGSPGNFEVVVLEDDRLVHYWKDNSDVRNLWQPGGVISTRATGPGCIIQSNVGSPGNFEVVVLEDNRLVHYWKHNSDVRNLWQPGGVISTRATGPGCIIQSNVGSPGNFEVVVLEDNRLVHYWKDNSDVRNLWQPGQVITTSARGPGCLTHAAFGRSGHFEVLARECARSVVHYWHDQRRRVPSLDPAGPVLGEDVPDPMPDVIKRGQLTGETDRHIGGPALNATESQFGIRGTDLGSSFLHDGKLFFFGDTWRTCVPDPPKAGATEFQRQNLLDAVAWSTDVTAMAGLRLRFNKQFPRVDGISQLEFEVPCEGLSAGGAMYVWFTTDHSLRRTMGRTVLARSTDGGLNFDCLYTLSTDKLINVSVQPVRNASVPGLPDTDGDGLVIFGSGRYRSSDVYLAYLPLDGLCDPSKGRLRFWSTGRWVREEDAAAPLFCAGCVGELSVRWSFLLGCWVMLYNSDNPPVIVLRTAQAPWGPWSEPRTLFDPWRSGGYCHFIHRGPLPDDSPPCDHVEDHKMENPLELRSDDWGGPYGPYQVVPYCSGVRGCYQKMYFTLSTWNPYDVMLMSAVVTPDGGPVPPHAHALDADAANDRKYARLSTLLARIAVAHGMSWDFPGQGIPEMPDHLEWAQAQPRQVLRDELKAKFDQIMAKISLSADRADAYAQISVTAAQLGGDVPSEAVGYDAHYGWAVQAIQDGHPQWLRSEMDARLQGGGLFRGPDEWCCAHAPDATNEQKYARVSTLLARLGAAHQMSWDSSGQGATDALSHFGWARLRPVQTVQAELIDKLRQVVAKVASGEAVADAYAQVTVTMVVLGADGPHDVTDYRAHYDWAISAPRDWLISETELRVRRERFLASSGTR